MARTKQTARRSKGKGASFLQIENVAPGLFDDDDDENDNEDEGEENELFGSAFEFPLGSDDLIIDWNSTLFNNQFMVSIAKQVLVASQIKII